MKTRRIKATLRVHDIAVAGASTGISISLRARLMGASAIAGGALRGLAIAAGMVTVFGGVFESLHGGGTIRGSRPSQPAFNDLLDMRALSKRNQQANFQQLLLRRADYESSQIPRHPGFQNP